MGRKKLGLVCIAVVLAAAVLGITTGKRNLQAGIVSAQKDLAAIRNEFHTVKTNISASDEDLERRVSRLESAVRKLDSDLIWIRNDIRSLESTVRRLEFNSHRH